MFDDTLAVGPRPGPVPVDYLRSLRQAGNMVGICGNWRNLFPAVHDWWTFISFIGPLESHDKEYVQHKVNMLRQLKMYQPGKQGYFMIGNAAGRMGPWSVDDQVARAAGFTFISENDFMRNPNR